MSVYLFENPYPALTLGVLVAGFCAAAFHVTRKSAFLWTIAATVLAVGTVFLLCYFVDTPRKQVKAVIDEGISAVCANDIERIIALLAPNAGSEIAPYIRQVSRMVKFTAAKASNVKITVNELTSPHSAKAEFHALVLFQGSRGEIIGDRYACRMVLTLEKQGGKWLIVGYTEKPLVGK